jgi:23S rRNA pseudouridine1911/1915/1917 synthase
MPGPGGNEMPKMKIEVIHKDDDIIVINKPSGVSVTADRSGQPQLVDILAEQLGPQIRSELRLVHRLDKHTSGVMILALNPQAQSAFSSYFERKLVKKTYLALVTGVVRGQEGTIDMPLAQNRKKPALMCINRKKGKEAITEWKLLADFGTIALLAVSPLTGRTHQIRVHLPSIRLPLLIDPLYGNPKPFFLSDFKTDYRLGKGRTENPLIERLTLHAYQLELPKLSSVIPAHSVIPAQAGIHVNTEPSRPDCFIAALDKKFAATIKMLTKHNPKGIDALLNPDDFSKIINAQRLFGG